VAVWAVKAVASEVWKTAHYAPCILAVVGLVALRGRVLAEPGLAVLLLLGIINLAVIYTLGLKIGYVSERHTLLIVLIVCYLAAASLEPIARTFASLPLGRFGAVGLLAGLVASALPATLRPLHENRVGHYHAGKYLASVLTPDDAVVDPFSWAEFYSGRTLYYIPKDPEHAQVVYAVLENTDNSHSRLPRLELAKSFVSPDRVVYHWPDNGPVRGAKVIVYKTVVLRKPPHFGLILMMK
jgi:hypothetical protein